VERQLLASRRLEDDGFHVVTPLRGVNWRALLSAAAVAGIVIGAANACEPTVVIGSRFCPLPPAEGGATPDPGTPVDSPWSTGFEDGFCDYAQPMGFCFATGSGAFALVTAPSPVHSGRYAAAFSVRADGDGGQGQTRCVRQGAFPPAAYYGAWYYVPAPATNGGNWNLLHFQSGDAGQTLRYMWDVSLFNLSDGGGLSANLVDLFNPRATPTLVAVPPIPIGQWFHLEVFFNRTKDATGEIKLLQDGLVAADFTGLVTDPSDWGQWYVGNLATALSPPDSTVYVDDITIGSAP
jgi:hypothetical protein